MERYTVLCTCDDVCDEPCPAHGRENMMQDELIYLRGVLDDIVRWLDTPGQASAKAQVATILDPGE